MNGILNVLKPPGMTSSNVVSDLRRILNIKKVGHTGTLDPFAAGVLPVCIGKATRLSDYIMTGDKEYIAELVLGYETDTQDTAGSVAGISLKTDAKEEEFLSVLPKFLGQTQQQTPMYSAVKVQGRKLYEYAHKGIGVQAPKRTIDISKLELIRKTAPGRFLFRVCCSKGTYVRTLCSDIAREMGSLGTMSFLLRTAASMFRIEDAKTLDQIKNEAETGKLKLISMDGPLQHLPAAYADETMYKQIQNGNSFAYCGDAGVVRVYCRNEFIGIGEAGNETVKMKLILI